MSNCDDVEDDMEEKEDDNDIYYDAISASKKSTATYNSARTETRESLNTVCNGKSTFYIPTSPENNTHKALAQELSQCLACRASQEYELSRNVNVLQPSSSNNISPLYELSHTVGSVVDPVSHTLDGYKKQQPSRLKVSEQRSHQNDNVDGRQNRPFTKSWRDNATEERIYSEPVNSGFLLNRSSGRSCMSHRRKTIKKGKRTLSKSLTMESYDRLHRHPDFTQKSMTGNVAGKKEMSLRRKPSSTRRGRLRRNSLPLTSTLSVNEENPYSEAAHSGSVSEGDENIYETVEFHRLGDLDSDVSWGSEFESSSDSEYEFPNKPLPAPPSKLNILTFFSPQQPVGQIQKNLSPSERNLNDSEDDILCLPVKLDAEKHPPPFLPPVPGSLEAHQVKRRHVIANIIDSEKSYMESLDRIIAEYEEPMLNWFGFQNSPLKSVLRKSHDILSHHRMFQIELAEKVGKWDEDEKIGDTFTATFSKVMVQDAYSAYVNNFSLAMQDIKTKQRTDQAFRDFLLNSEANSRDRLPVSGLMVKPVQRFPQFIMLMQELLKYTPRDHHDRRALQLALTELENVAHHLNERKRENEQHFQADQILSKLNFKFGINKLRRLLREDEMKDVEVNCSQARQKDRRLFLMNDMIICVSSTQRDEDDASADRYKQKWSAKLRDLDLKESALTPELQATVKGEASRMNPKYDLADEDPYNLYADLSEMMHDHEVLKNINTLISQLKRSYEDLTNDLVSGMSRDLQEMIQVKDQQLQIVNSCSIILYDNLRKIQHILHTHTPQMKQAWCQDFIMAKLALEPQNNPGWDFSHTHREDTHLHIPALFLKYINVDMPRHYTKMSCGVPVFLSMPGTTAQSLQHLWVCTNTESRGQVSIVSVHPHKPSLIESFQAANHEITCVEVVPGFGIVDDQLAIAEDAVWMATSHADILVYKLYDSDGIRRQQITRREPHFAFHLPGVIVGMKYIEDRIFAGLTCGMLVIFSRDDDGVWNIKSPRFLELGCDPITTLLPIDTSVWVACGNYVHIFDWEECIKKEKHQLKCDTADESDIMDMVRSGVGLFVSYKEKSIIRLYHLETKESLQEISVASSVERIIVKNSTLCGKQENMSARGSSVTCLMASRGLLWIGTSLGIILTLPLPRLQDGVPLLSGRPSVSFHAHNGPVRYIIPINIRSSGFRSQVKTNGAVHLCQSSEPNVVSKKYSASNITLHEKESPLLPRNRRMSLGIDMVPPNYQTNHVHVGQPTPFKEAETSVEGENDKSLTFRTELATKLAHRKNLSSSTPNLFEASAEEEVIMLYRDLMKKEDFSVLKSQKSKTLGSGWKQAKLSKHFKKFTMDSKSNSLKGNTENVLDIKYKHEPRALPVDCAKQLKKRSSSRVSSIVPKQDSVSVSRSSSQAQRHRIMQESTLDKRSTDNCIVVMSGGDGYVEWRHQGASSAKNNDACMLLWMYKF